MSSNHHYELYQHILELQRETADANVQAQAVIYGGGSPEEFAELSCKVGKLRDQCDVLIKVLTGRPRSERP